MSSRSVWLCLIAPALCAQAPSSGEIRAAAARSIPAIQRGVSGFYKIQDCFSCHHHGMAMLTLRMARERGVSLDEASARDAAAKGLSKMPDFTSLDRAVQDNTIIDPVVSDGWGLLAADAAGVSKTLITAVYARRIANWQRADGHFPTGDARPPQSYSSFTATAIAARVMNLYLPEQLGPERAERLSRAKRWLLSAQPASTEDYAFRLFGLYWAGTGAAERRKAVSDLMALQRPNGGWAQLPHLEPDAYSTGEALVALDEAGGLAVKDAGMVKGLRYLLSTQDDQGVWHVHTRMISPAPVSPSVLRNRLPLRPRSVPFDGWHVLGHHGPVAGLAQGGSSQAAAGSAGILGEGLEAMDANRGLRFRGRTEGAAGQRTGRKLEDGGRHYAAHDDGP